MKLFIMQALYTEKKYVPNFLIEKNLEVNDTKDTY